MDTSVYSHALDIWAKADLTNLQRELDADVIEIKDKETLSLNSRKSLATETKKFKKLEPEEKLNNVNKIIKQYQREIDNLTQRSKFSEKVLFDVYEKLSEAPDPQPLLQSSLEKLGKIDDSKELKEKISYLEDKLAKYADYETLKSRLLDLEQSSAKTLAKRLTAKTQEINSTWEEKGRNWKEREADLLKQLTNVQEQNKALEAKISKNIDIEGNGNEDGDQENNQKEVSTRIAEYNLVTQELETTQARIYQLEKRNEELSGALAKATSEAEKETELHAKELKLNQLESENALLSASYEQERKSTSHAINELKEQLNGIVAESESYKSELETVRRKLNNYSDYNKIKEELSALKKIEFGVNEDDSDNDIRSEDKNDNTFESSLLSANKKLQATLAEYRSKSTAQEEERNELKKSVDQLKQQIATLKEANEKLETDLEKVENVSPHFNETASMMSGVTRQMNNRTSHKMSPTSSIIGIPEDGELSGNQSTILPIVTKQRDRFRSRNMDLEKQLRQGNSEKGKLKLEISKLKGDNTKLYERIRYLQSYNNNNAPVNQSTEGIDVESQYSRVYDESLHPMANFRQNELNHYKNKKLSALEKLFSSFAKVILQNKMTRMVFLFYCIGLHGLVFMMSMYVINISGYMTPEVGIVQSAKSSSNLNGGLGGAEKVAAGAGSVHGINR
ncbi:CLL_collapsed_G0031890.mRNA.1.CDS.1 [Saccharomyces cerevisiae]|uniref:Protein CASP n=1 Tax=Saccharomyces cerevisiae (strain Kyokai no. 7 / NBRC 101557) TaxID=721032 RepID=G2WHL4_YEASK|nr:Coy1p [Saccharomyces cerevisiae YJM1388]AJS48915.1 Coy1p [Saccharomyces cerevisiae YJM1389]AJS53049.1 Coy1p [Saccharomyces cerevisiae YJM1447]AJS53636.1 Coy1p [Saccharomyces cerevisiae YJM1460]AJS56594.1 Coy1p [Saccharomyces cerevisiae YJM1592]CAI4569192.1 ADQ_G0031500.mRNA.1.CDS.1 [Saccharomyces cerevisiae]GAA24557.1 K7_Coy1p [Saccharomyces cerevisiae Kyokai no. 7]